MTKEEFINKWHAVDWNMCTRDEMSEDLDAVLLHLENKVYTEARFREMRQEVRNSRETTDEQIRTT